jgi:hypothetical protein
VPRLEILEDRTVPSGYQQIRRRKGDAAICESEHVGKEFTLLLFQETDGGFDGRS